MYIEKKGNLSITIEVYFHDLFKEIMALNIASFKNHNIVLSSFGQLCIIQQIVHGTLVQIIFWRSWYGPVEMILPEPRLGKYQFHSPYQDPRQSFYPHIALHISNYCVYCIDQAGVPIENH
jgi:hypothetical protein